MAVAWLTERFMRWVARVLAGGLNHTRADGQVSRPFRRSACGGDADGNKRAPVRCTLGVDVSGAVHVRPDDFADAIAVLPQQVVVLLEPGLGSWVMPP